jgi:hypothetical protein
LAQRAFTKFWGSRWRTTLGYGLFAVVMIFAIVRVESVSHANDQHIAETTRAIVAQTEANCRARDAQLRQAASSNAGGRKFILDLGKKLAEDGEMAASRFIRSELRKTKPIKPPPPANCDFPDVLPLPEGGSGD